MPDIAEKEHYWLVYFNPDATTVDTDEIFGGVIEYGIKENKLVPKNIWLPKSYYPTKESLKKIIEKFERCSLCKHGVELSNKKIFKQPFILKNTDMMASEVGSLVLGNFVAEGYKFMEDKYIKPKVGGQVASGIKVAIGGMLVLSTFGFTMGRKTELAVLGAGANLIASGVAELLKSFVSPATRTQSVRLVPVSSTPTAPQFMPTPGYNLANLTM